MQRMTFKYRLYPTRAQRTAMQKALEACRWVYNEALVTRKDAWEQEQCSVVTGRSRTNPLAAEWSYYG